MNLSTLGDGEGWLVEHDRVIGKRWCFLEALIAFILKANVKAFDLEASLVQLKYVDIFSLFDRFVVDKRQEKLAEYIKAGSKQDYN